MESFLAYIEQYSLVKSLLLLGVILITAWLSYVLVHRVLLVLLKKAASKPKQSLTIFWLTVKRCPGSLISFHCSCLTGSPS